MISLFLRLKKFQQLKKVLKFIRVQIKHLSVLSTEESKRKNAISSLMSWKSAEGIVKRVLIRSNITIPECRIDIVQKSSDFGKAKFQIIFSRYSVDMHDESKVGFRVYVYFIIDMQEKTIRIKYVSTEKRDSFSKRVDRMIDNTIIIKPCPRYYVSSALNSAFQAMVIDTDPYVVMEGNKKKYLGSVSSGPKNPIKECE